MTTIDDKTWGYVKPDDSSWSPRNPDQWQPNSVPYEPYRPYIPYIPFTPPMKVHPAILETTTRLTDAQMEDLAERIAKKLLPKIKRKRKV